MSASTLFVRRRGRRLAALLTAALLVTLGGPALLPAAEAADGGKGAVTVAAPGAGPDASVTVSSTRHLVNQSVRVSWSGFRPSSASRLDNSGGAVDVNTENPVRVYQCRGLDPSSSSECYGSPGFRGMGASGSNPAIDPVPGFTYPGQVDPYDGVPDGPANWQDNVTSADGTGEVVLQLFTERESAALGCDDETPCSIVVVPNYGRPQGATEDLMDAPWAWDRRTVVPLDFLPVADACPLSGASIGVEGSPMAARAMASWRARTCTLDKEPVRLDYTAIGEPQSRQDLASGATDVGLVVDPVPTDEGADRALVYAPLALTGLVVAFQVDDAHGRPVREMHLDPRLVAKLVTASYRSGGNPATIDNPVNIFRDPEFLELNPGIDWPGGAPGNHPLLLGDLSDTTLALTRWLASDKDARDFLAGKPDPYGMTVNSNYKGIELPFASFPLLDPQQSNTFQPIQELDSLARQLSLAQFPGSLTTVEDGISVVTKPPRQNPGRREVIGIIDAASAATFQLSTAALRNSAGEFVAPGDDGFRAGVAHAVTGPDGVTRTVDQTSKDPDVYPLTMLVSAGLSTRAAKTDRTSMVRLLDYVAADGQARGEEAGQLPPGYTPLTPTLVKQVQVARAAVLAGAPGDSDDADDPSVDPGSSGAPGSPATGTGSGTVPSGSSGVGGVGTSSGSSGTAGSAGTGSPASAKGGPDGRTTTAEDEITLTVSPVADEQRNWWLAKLCVLAVLLLLAGPGVLVLSRSSQAPAWMRR